MTWQCHNILVSTHFWLFIVIEIHRNLWLVQLSTMLNTSKLTLYRTYSQKLRKCAHFYFGNDMFASKSNEVESRYLPEKVTSLEVESSV